MDGTVPVDSMPHVINPACGYVFNTNNNVYDATCEGQNDNPHRLPAYANQRPGNNNRAETLKEFFRTHDRVDFDAFRKIKFEEKMNANSIFMKSLTPLWQLDKSKYPASVKLYQQYTIVGQINRYKLYRRNLLRMLCQSDMGQKAL
jgi:acyl-homoserine lactone acylase PvdQ